MTRPASMRRSSEEWRAALEAALMGHSSTTATSRGYHQTPRPFSRMAFIAS
jgi:hypothetical protein